MLQVILLVSLWLVKITLWSLTIEVNMATGECQCSRGATHGQCKHKFAITHYYKIAAFSALPANDPGMRATWDYVWTGVVLVRPAHRYRGLEDEDHDGPGVE